MYLDAREIAEAQDLMQQLRLGFTTRSIWARLSESSDSGGPVENRQPAMTEMPFSDLVVRVLVLGVPLIVIWWLIVKRLQKFAAVGSPCSWLRRMAPAVAGVAIAVSVFFYIYAVFPIWAFTLGCIVGLLFGEKRARPMVVWGAVALLAFELFYDPKFRELGRRRFLVRPPASESPTE